MTATVKNKTPLVVPLAVQRRAGLACCGPLEFRATGGVITITAKPPAADEDYTPEQRRAIDTQLDQAAERPFHGPFDTADEMIAHIKGQLKTRAAVKKPKKTLSVKIKCGDAVREARPQRHDAEMTAYRGAS